MKQNGVNLCHKLDSNWQTCVYRWSA